MLPPKVSLAQSLKASFSAWRLTSVALLSFSSGLPLGLVLSWVPTWLTDAGVNVKTIGVLTLAQAPYAFKFVWSPLMDRFRLPVLGRKRGWIALTQLVLAGATFALAAAVTEPGAGRVEVGLVAALTVLISFASASQDIVVDAYAVEVLRPDEHGLAVGARTAMYRAAMWLVGSLAISAAPWIGWANTAAIQGLIYLLLMVVAIRAPEPEAPPAPPASLREAVWEPLAGFLRQSRALEIAAFLLLYKLADNLAGALVKPFLVQRGYPMVDVGIASGTVGIAATLAGTFLGGVLTTRLGLGRSLWLFGILQALSNVGYAIVAAAPLSRVLLYGAIAVETGTTGMGTGAFSVLLLRLTHKRFSATQYALFSSIFALGRTISGPPAGALVDAIGWRDFFLLTIPCALPGLAMLQRFAPWGTRELAEVSDAPSGWSGAPASRRLLALVGAAGAVLATCLGLLADAGLAALKARTARTAFDLRDHLLGSLDFTSRPLTLIGASIFGVVTGCAVAAYLAVRRGVEAPAFPGPDKPRSLGGQ